jgi:small subunit ribosomal protein S1
MTQSFAEMFEESLANQELRRGAVVTGTVVAIQPDSVIVNAGLKSEGVIPIEEFKNASGEVEVQVGDEVEVSLEAVEDGFGETRLSREKAKRDQVWRRLEKAFENEDIVKGVISGKVKGGFTVDIEEIRAFLPGSLVDVRPVRDPVYLEGKELEFKVIKLDQRRNNVVVSRRAVVETEFSAEREALLESLQEGMTIKGIVKNLTIMASSWTSAVSMVCCISPTWPGSVSSTPPKLSTSVTRSRSRFSSLIGNATACHWV